MMLASILIFSVIELQESFSELNSSNSTDLDNEICGDHLCSESPIIRYTPTSIGINTNPKYALPHTTIHDLIEGGVPISNLTCGNKSLEIMIHDIRPYPICVTSQTAEKLEIRGWGLSLQSILEKTEYNFNKKFFDPIHNFTISYYGGGEIKTGPDFKKILDDVKSNEFYLDAYVNNTFWSNWFNQTYPNLTVQQALGIDPWPEVCFNEFLPCFEGENDIVQIRNEMPISISKINSYDDTEKLFNYADTLCSLKNEEPDSLIHCESMGGSGSRGINDYSEKHNVTHRVYLSEDQIFQIATVGFSKQNETWVFLSTLNKPIISNIEERIVIEKFKKIINSFTIDKFQHNGI